LLAGFMPMCAVDGEGGGDEGAGDKSDEGEGGEGSTMGQGAQGEGEATGETGEKGEAGEHWAPEKYQVKNEAGEIDVEATAKKQADAFKALETRMGTDGVRPKTADEYTFEVPDDLKDQWKPDEDDDYKDFKVKAHELGFTQKQFEYAVGRHLESLGQVQGSDAQMSQEDTQNALREIWPDQKTYQKNLNAAWRGASSYANPGDQTKRGSMINLERKFGEDPDFIAFAANIGREIKEDIPPMGSVLGDETVEAMQKSEAYWNPNDPKHEEVKAKVTAHYSRKYQQKH